MTGPASAQLLTVKQTAELLGIRPGTVYLWLAQRKLPKVTLGRSVRVLLAAVEELVRANTIPARGGRP